MFESPTRNHFTLIFERLAAILAFFSVYLINSLQNYGWEIFTPSFYVDLIKSTLNGGYKSALGFLAFLVLVVVCLFMSYRYWLKTFFYIEGTDFIYKRNTMFKVDSRLPIQNIAIVNVESNIFERLVGTAKVKIDLNSSRTASKTDFKFVLKRDEAQLLKESLLGIKARQSAEAAVSDAVESDAQDQFFKSPDVESVQARAEERRHVVTFSTGEALLHKLLSFPIIQSLMTIMLIFVLPMLKTEGSRNMNRLWFLLFIAVGGSVVSVVKGALDLGDYTVERDSKVLYISCGILNKRNYVFEREKINAVVINEPILARLLGLCSISLAVVGLGNEKNETTHLSLITKKDKAMRIISECVPDFVCATERVRTHPLSLVSGFLRAAFWGAATLLLGLMYSFAYIMATAMFVFLLIGTFIEFATRYYAADDKVVYYSKGIFNRSQGIVKYEDMQDVRIRTNIFLRRANIAKMTFTILSASAMKRHKTGWFDVALFNDVADKVVEAEDKGSMIL